jgi:hypothetical protein
MARIALIARLGRRPEMREITRHLESMGHVMCSRWVRLDTEDDEMDQYGKANSALQNADDLESSHLAIAFTERRPFTPGTARGGRHADLGYALSVCSRVIVVGPRENIAYFSPKIELVDTVAQLLELLRNPSRNSRERKVLRKRIE